MKKNPIFNVPNMLSLLRVALVPAFVAALLFMIGSEVWGIIIPAILYGLTALTDMLDGKIARKYGLVTDFGKFIDPLADKFMVLGSMLAILAWMFIRGEMLQGKIFVWLVLIILFRELAVTSLRLVVAGKKAKVDLAAKVVSLDNAKDPDEYIKCFGKDAYIQALSKATHGFEFRMNRILKRYDLSQIEEKIESAKELVLLIAETDSAVTRDIYARIAAERLEISADAILLDVMERENI